MRPIKLAVQAFGPFAGRVEMDFRAIGDAPLFGIYGPTGGGKTSILDAICYALFGESSGGDRSAEHLRSHFADPAVGTFVELILKIGEKRYLIRRAPTQEIAKKRGKGLTERQQEAYLFDATNLQVDDISYPNNPGTLLAEKKVGEVKEIVKDLLGYEVKQFRQVVVLPQGQFRELLTAQSRDRSEILRKLFDTSVYMRLTLRLKEKRSAINQDLGKAKEAMKTILDGVNVETIEVLTAAIEDKAGEISIADQKVQGQEVEALKAETALEHGKRLDEQFKELDTASTVASDFAARTAEVEEKAATLRSAEAALRVVPAADSADAATTALREAMEDLEAKKSGAKEAAIDLEQATRAFAESEAREPERAALRRRLGDLERFRKTWNDLAQKRRAVDAAKQTCEDAEVVLATAEQAMKDGEDKLKEASTKEADLSKAKERKAILERDAERLAGGCKLLENLETANFEVKQAEPAVQAASSELEGYLDTLVVARERREVTERAFLASTAAHLATDLTPGEPCPVCGSVNHPSPATTEAETITREEMEEARTVFADAETRFNEKRDQVSDLTMNLKGLRTRVMELAASVPTDLVLADVREDIARLRDELKTVTSLVDMEDTIRAERTGAEAALDKARIALTAAQEAKSEAEKVLTRLKAELETALKDVPEDLRDEGVLSAAVENVVASLRDALSLHEAARATLQTASQDHDTKAALAKASDALAAKAEVKAATERVAFERALDQYGFDDEDTFKAAWRGEEETTALRTAIEGFHKEKAAAEDRLRRATGEVDGKERPDVTALDKIRADAKAALEDARDGKTTLESEHKHLLDARQRYGEKAVEYDRLDTVYREVALLGDVADGRGPNVERIPLVDYVLQTYFEDVLRHANMRFQRMSRDRYVLRRKQGASGGRGTAGLDITVFDTYTDQERDAATLSGGESFLAALSLALGLSDVVQAEAGGIRLDAIFIDEGFGHLDEEALDKALDTLVELSGSARSVGIISHVEDVKRMVPAGFDVTRAATGSEIRVRSGG